MKKLFFLTVFLLLANVFPDPTMAGVDVNINIGLPPLIGFVAPPEVVVIPGTYVYAVPDIDVELFFYNGWWWRPWEGRWYRSRHYNSGWAYYQRVPSFYPRIPPTWRNNYRDHRWEGHHWDYQRIPHQQAERNWRGWEKNKHWEKQQNWGVPGYKPRMQSQQPSRSVQPQYYERPQSRMNQPQHREMQPEYRQQSREPQPQYSRPQHYETPQQSYHGHGQPEKGGGEKHDR